jgi:hypothetical protein
MTRLDAKRGAAAEESIMSRIVWSSVVLAASLVASARAEDPPTQPPAPKVETKDQTAQAYLKELKAQMAKMADQDAKAAIKKLVEMWKDKELGDDTKKPIPGLLEQFGREEKTLVAIDAIDALGELDAAASSGPVLKILDKALSAKEPSVDIYGACLRAMKKLADTKPSTVKTLLDYMKSPKDDVVAKVAEALSGYKDAPGKVRKEILEEIIKGTEGTYAKSQDAKNSNDVRRWNIINFGVMRALNDLSGQKFADVLAARKWFNEHKKDKSWDK